MLAHPPRLVAFPLAEWEREGLATVLRRADLPAADIDAAGHLFWRFERDDGTPAGFGGLDLHRPDALLRSVVTLPPMRGNGVGRAIVAALESEAAAHHCRATYVATVHAAGFFVRLGYRRCKPGAVPAVIRDSVQIKALDPDEAELLTKRIG